MPSRVKKCEQTGKRKYRDRIAALLTLAEVQKRDGSRRAKGSEKSVYRCPHCGAWHLTSRS
jgi:rubrerythrin